MTAKLSTKWPNRRPNAVGLGIVALALAYILGSRAFNTGSWWEYLGTLALLIYGFNRLITALKG